MKVETDKAGVTTVELTAPEVRKIADTISILRQVAFYEQDQKMQDAADQGSVNCANLLCDLVDREVDKKADSESKDAN